MKLPKAYEPSKYETDIYAIWEKSKAFEPKNRGAKGTYSIVVPPPNANGNLHLGHGLTLALEDIAVRYHRMKGEAALLLPGADHAGFETQVVYEKELAKQGKSRFDLSREELYAQIWDFVAANRENYESQFRKLGASVDWTRYVFTLDEKIVKRAYTTFKKMWDEKLIYRGERLVNFCTFHGTAFADIEVAHRQEPGHLWYIKYPLTDGSGSVTVATTRPETMLGDTAVAVHPDDKRYAKFVGKTIKLPLTKREIPVIADRFVDTSFGTGAVKITPAHDQNDFEAGERHDLPKISVIDHEGKLTDDAGEAYRGLTVDEARKKVVEDLDKLGVLTKTEAITHSVGHCYKCDTVIQPLLREQWFVDMQPLASEAIKALKAGKIKFYPANKKQQLIKYLEGLKDWNISRQIAWGIPIPAFQNMDDSDDWIYDERVGEQELKIGSKIYRRDPDVFDTWFSSGQWPYATLNYPDGKDFNQFYPLSVMETAADILYPWVSRMIMFGLYITGKVPFEEVYLHGLIQDEKGQKMSKSKGNVLDPIELCEKFGSDAFRMGIIADETAGGNRPYDQSKMVGARNFANKLWNVARYVEDTVGSDYKQADMPEPTSLADHWILTKLQHFTEVISTDLDNYRFADAYDKLYHAVWDDFADWYIEASKVEPNNSVLAYSLETILKLAHPFAPFVTEAIWQNLKWNDELLIVSAWPVSKDADKAGTKAFEEVKNIVGEIRYLSTELKLSNPTLHYHESSVIEQNREMIKRLAKIGDIEPGKTDGLQLIQTSHKVWLDVDKNQIKWYISRLAEQGREQAGVVKMLEDRLDNKNYVQNAPKVVVEQTHEQLNQAREQLAKLESEQKRFSS
ncbi:MAG TPA: valine--tRNA ligase [Patescibacteria group bacterium]|nr:valine--tRNA ligase [Patescibacteria group bacterium]